MSLRAVTSSVRPMPSDEYSWQFYLTPPDAWEAMYEDCLLAKTSIELEQYIMENDAVGRRFMELFIDKALQGLRVFIICDKFGSATWDSSPLVEKLREAGGQFYFYN